VSLGIIFAIALGGAAGALGRYWVSLTAHSVLGTAFPYGTLTVNVVGSFLMGLLSILLLERVVAAPELRAFILVGFLGAFTTFSTFSLETFHLFLEGAYLKSFINVVVSVFICLTAVWLGMLLGRRL
jgi:CrcB protein